MEVAILTLLIWIFTSEITPASISSLILAVTALFTIVTAFVNWRIDRRRLSTLENDRDIMRNDLEKHKEETIETFKEIRNSINLSSGKVTDKIDDLKMFLLQSKITIKGEDEKNR